MTNIERCLRQKRVFILSKGEWNTIAYLSLRSIWEMILMKRKSDNCELQTNLFWKASSKLWEKLQSGCKIHLLLQHFLTFTKTQNKLFVTILFCISFHASTVFKYTVVFQTLFTCSKIFYSRGSRLCSFYGTVFEIGTPHRNISKKGL